MPKWLEPKMRKELAKKFHSTKAEKLGSQDLRAWTYN